VALLRRPAGGRRNLDFDVQEVMSGANRRDWLRARTLWFSFLSQGLLRAGVANSDTHSFAIEQAGYPRTLVSGQHSVAAFDPVTFNQAVREGRITGTNGPVLDVRLESPENPAVARPSLTALVPPPGAAITVLLKVAPWIPVTELRFVVNGRVVKTVPVFEDAADPLGLKPRSVEIRQDLATLLNGHPGDAWVLVEAGLALPLSGDLDGDGFADTLDNDKNGVVDAADIPADPDDEDRRFPNPGRPMPSDARFHLEAIAPGTWTYAFTNPFLLDRNGGGWSAPGL
jgi:hypothetical protein